MSQEGMSGKALSALTIIFLAVSMPEDVLNVDLKVDTTAEGQDKSASPEVHKLSPEEDFQTNSSNVSLTEYDHARAPRTQPERTRALPKIICFNNSLERNQTDYNKLDSSPSGFLDSYQINTFASSWSRFLLTCLNAE
ncbi:unnamed protein product [Nesidiocoris tenuis]|uniref:Uncharacterized protein n=1 Tax=Nesidiocoris tenuis TaxID=355587 RepID=A0A6H5GHY0_9HEMI|nr:unnamed protein product [Nesidiocoris tenuis]